MANTITLSYYVLGTPSNGATYCANELQHINITRDSTVSELRALVWEEVLKKGLNEHGIARSAYLRLKKVLILYAFAYNGWTYCKGSLTSKPTQPVEISAHGDLTLEDGSVLDSDTGIILQPKAKISENFLKTSGVLDFLVTWPQNRGTHLITFIIGSLGLHNLILYAP